MWQLCVELSGFFLPFQVLFVVVAKFVFDLCFGGEKVFNLFLCGCRDESCDLTTLHKYFEKLSMTTCSIIFQHFFGAS